MKKFLFAGLILAHFSTAVEIGSSRNGVLTELGEPQGSMKSGDKEILLFDTGTVTLQHGTVIKTDLSPDYVRQSEVRALELEKSRAAKQSEQEKQKLLFPEDHVTRIDCAYSKTEDWNNLPETIRPEPGRFQYDIYIPQGYHGSGERRYPCLFLESPALWDSIKERTRAEKWIVIILPEPGPQNIGKTMNGNFLAAFDDAVRRFRISREHIFITGRVPASIFSTMRPVAGIILHEPDFKGFEKAGFHPDFLRQNRNLRVYAMLGNQYADNVRYQGEFIVGNIPKHYVGVYEGNTAVMPKPLTDQAIDWMKKEYDLP